MKKVCKRILSTLIAACVLAAPMSAPVFSVEFDGNSTPMAPNESLVPNIQITKSDKDTENQETIVVESSQMTEDPNELYKLDVHTGGWNIGGDWKNYDDGHNLWTENVDAIITLRFIGTEISLYSGKTSNGGYMGITVDGGEEQLVDLSCESEPGVPKAMHSDVVWTMKDLSPDEVHTVVFRCTGKVGEYAEQNGENKWLLNIDKVKISSPVKSIPCTDYTEQDGPDPYQFHITDGWWICGSHDHATTGMNLWTTQAGSKISLKFRGTGISYWTVKVSNQGKIGITVDGGEEEIVDLSCDYNTEENQHVFIDSSVVWSKTGLDPNVEHEIVFRCTGEKGDSVGVTDCVVNIDKVEIMGCPDAEEIEERGDNWKLVWHDEFEGTELDRSKWDPWWCDWDGAFQRPENELRDHAMVSDKFYSVQDGVLRLGNGEFAAIGEEDQKIGAYSAHSGYTSLITKYTYQQQYGFIEVRFRRQAENPMRDFAFWMMPTNGFYGRGGNGAEVDFIENGAWNDGLESKFNTIWGGYDSGYRILCSNWYQTNMNDGNFHTIGVDWSPTYMRLYYDGEFIVEHSASELKSMGGGIPQCAQYLILQSSAMGGLGEEGYQGWVEFDYVRCYQYEGEGSIGRVESIGVDNALQNGDFESGTLDAWTVEENSATVDGTEVHSGEYAAHIPSGATMKQTVDLLPWNKYRATAWVKLADPDGTAALEVRNYDIDNQNNPFTPKRVTATGDGWQKISVEFVLGNWTKQPDIVLMNESSDVIYLDDLQVVQVDDLALHGVASADSMKDHNYYYEAQKAVDGYENTNDSNAVGYEAPWKATSTKWASEGSGPHWLQVDLRKEQTIQRYQVRHAGAYEEDAVNTRDFRFEVSSDGENWTTLDTVTGNTADITERNVAATKARYVRLFIDDDEANIYEFSVFGDANTELETVTPVNGISLDRDLLTLTQGESTILKAVVAPENASNQKVFWKSSDETIAKVDTNGTVYALQAGEATITATTEDGKFQAEARVIVTSKEAPLPTDKPQASPPAVSGSTQENSSESPTETPATGEDGTIFWMILAIAASGLGLTLAGIIKRRALH